MFFRNLTFFRFPTTTDFSEVDTLLPHALLKPVGALEMNSRGFIYHRADRKQGKQHGRTLTRHSDNRSSLSPLRRTTVPDLAAGSGTPKTRPTFVPIDAIREALKMTKISDKPDSLPNTPKITPSQSTGTQTRDRARSDPGRYGAFEVVTRDKYYVP